MSFGPLIPVTTMAGRLGVILLGVVFLVWFLSLSMRFGPSFFRGFLVAVGAFLSFDMILFHWVFRLHRITSGPEADIRTGWLRKAEKQPETRTFIQHHSTQAQVSPLS